ncbi:MAG: Ldh family oxidoreductase [Chloroflexi bacterium]|nr:Ldh family oxidoreductase [Chloroflexota bacterium]
MAGAQQDVLVNAEVLRRFAQACLARVGVPPEDAAKVADNLLYAQLRGVDSHGVTRLLKTYVERVQAGLVNVRPAIAVLQDGPSTAALDGDNGLGAVVGSRAVTVCLEKAREVGSAWVAVRNSNHFGTCAFYTNRIADAGMVGFVFTNAPATMAPWGGVKAYFGTNPIAFAAPMRSGATVSVDMATSVAARGYILLAAAKNEPIPEGWALDAEGRPTTDPHRALAGSLMPMSAHKGAALALMVDVLSGVLTGAAFGASVGEMYGETAAHPQGVGHLVGALAIDRFLPLETFFERMDQLAGEVRANPPASGVKRIYLPGEIEAAKAEQRQRDGIPVPAAIHRQLQELGDRLGVSFNE